VIAAQRTDGHEVFAAAGEVDGAPDWPGPAWRVQGLDARTRAPAGLDRLHAALAPDIVHVHTVMNPAALEWAAARGAVVTVQDHRHFCPGRGKWTLRGQPCRQAMSRDACAECFEDEGYFAALLGLTQERLQAIRGLQVTVLSRYMRGELIAAGLDPRRVHVVPPFVHGLAQGAGGEPPPRTHVLFAGRLVEAKGVRDAIAAWHRSGVDLPLVMAGTGPLRAFAQDAGAQVLGWVDRQRLGALYRGAAALIMPSRWQEPFGIAGLEALALGCPVAAWRSGGVPEWHPGGALMVEWGDVDGLADALRAAMAEGHAAPPEGFTSGAAMSRLGAVYEAARGGGGRRECGIF
jgi:glycosyltransferase involved in cell wall biosynthesis